MSLHSSQGLEEEYSLEVCWGGEPWLQSKSKTIQGGFCYNGKLTDSYLDFLSGTMYRHSQELSGEEESQSSQVDFHVKTSAPVEKERESKVNDQVCGNTWLALSMNVDLSMSTPKIVQCLLWEEVLEPSSVTLPKWGMMQNGVLWERITLPPLISGTGSGFWRTPECGKGGTVSMEALNEMADGNWKRESGHMRQLRLQDQVRHKGLWPKYWLTPTCVNVDPSDERRESRKLFRESVGRKDAPGGLAEQVAVDKFWPTPTCQENEHSHIELTKTGRRKSKNGKSSHSLNLADTVKSWPTPRARDWKGCNSVEGLVRPDGKSRMDALPNAVKYVTPRVGGEESLQSVEKRKGLDAAQTHNTLASVEAIHGEQRGQLNPDWVEWLMGWPIGWTQMAPLKGFDFRYWSNDPADDLDGLIPRMDVNIEDRTHRLKAIGNGQVPLCAAVAFEILNGE